MTRRSRSRLPVWTFHPFAFARNVGVAVVQARLVVLASWTLPDYGLHVRVLALSTNTIVVWMSTVAPRATAGATAPSLAPCAGVRKRDVTGVTGATANLWESTMVQLCETCSNAVCDATAQANGPNRGLPTSITEEIGMLSVTRTDQSCKRSKQGLRARPEASAFKHGEPGRLINMSGSALIDGHAARTRMLANTTPSIFMIHGRTAGLLVQKIKIIYELFPCDACAEDSDGSIAR